MTRFAPHLVLCTVTALLLAYGSHTWSWVAGPVAALFVWALDWKAHEPGEPSPVRVQPEPAPVD